MRDTDRNDSPVILELKLRELQEYIDGIERPAIRAIKRHQFESTKDPIAYYQKLLNTWARELNRIIRATKSGSLVKYDLQKVVGELGADYTSSKRDLGTEYLLQRDRVKSVLEGRCDGLDPMKEIREYSLPHLSNSSQTLLSSEAFA